ncbi:hypothetical protein [Domibacillus iocasae]|nr:hypothetical protein [Domibacillus iocasae]
MWIITVYLKNEMKMFEVDTEIEAKEVFHKTKRNKYCIKSSIYNDPSFH